MTDITETAVKADGIFEPTEAPKIGPLIRGVKEELARAYRTSDKALLMQVRVKREALAKLVGEIKSLDNTLYDTCHAGFTDATWLKGVERLVKLDPENPRGRKAQPKVDPADVV